MRRYSPLFLAGAVVAVGSYWSFEKGGHDFQVFHHAWNLVAHGHGTEIYFNSPDRFLYAPGFAWIFAPIGLIPERLALALWDLAKAAAVFWMIGAFSDWIRRAQPVRGKSRDLAPALAAGGIILCARPFLIEFQYGQVNTLILASCCWALFSYFDGEAASSRKAREARSIAPGLSWFFLGFVAASKLFALPLLLLPWFREGAGKEKKLKSLAWTTRIASLAGIAVALFLPLLTLGISQGLHMIVAWMDALAGKGLPLETHNQSFVALIRHYLTGAPTHVIALGPRWVVFGQPLLTVRTLTELGLAWSFLVGSFLLGWIVHSKKADPLRWMAVVIGLLFVPSYLVWKPYFVMTYPVAVLMLWRYRTKTWLIVLGFIAMNLSGFDLLGAVLAAHLEAASIFLLVHLAYLACVVWTKPGSRAKLPTASVMSILFPEFR